jgi:hypothetical protein
MSLLTMKVLRNRMWTLLLPIFLPRPYIRTKAISCAVQRESTVIEIPDLFETSQISEESQIAIRSTMFSYRPRSRTITVDGCIGQPWIFTHSPHICRWFVNCSVGLGWEKCPIGVIAIALTQLNIRNRERFVEPIRELTDLAF